MALIAAHLNAGVILVVWIMSRFPPVAYLIGDNSALNKSKPTTETNKHELTNIKYTH